MDDRATIQPLAPRSTRFRPVARIGPGRVDNGNRQAWLDPSAQCQPRGRVRGRRTTITRTRRSLGVAVAGMDRTRAAAGAGNAFRPGQVLRRNFRFRRRPRGTHMVRKQQHHRIPRRGRAAVVVSALAFVGGAAGDGGARVVGDSAIRTPPPRRPVCIMRLRPPGHSGSVPGMRNGRGRVTGTACLIYRFSVYAWVGRKRDVRLNVSF
jgi:hypothetical protein